MGAMTGNSSVNQGQASSDSDADLGKYEKMRRMRMPDGAIRHKMAADGVAAAEIAQFFGDAVGHAEATRAGASAGAGTHPAGAACAAMGTARVSPASASASVTAGPSQRRPPAGLLSAIQGGVALKKSRDTPPSSGSSSGGGSSS